MTYEQINAAIAEACGWTKINVEHRSGISPANGRFWVGAEFFPNYVKCLNAMHEAEKVLNSWDDYVNYQAWLGYCGGNAIVQLQQCITATARQRAEAFLRTLGKWEEATDKESLLVNHFPEVGKMVKEAGWPPPGTRALRLNADGKWEEVKA